MRQAISLIVLILLLGGCSQQTATPLDEQVDIGTHNLHLYCVGQGSPTVVIDVGFGETYQSWLPIIEQVSEKSRVCAYDRAGYGQSDIGPLPRHSKQVADELKLLLDTAGVNDPYLLVGHSLGGLNMQLFAAEYPDTVAGLVLLDPPPLTWIAGEGFPELYAMAQQETTAIQAAAQAVRESTNPEEKAQANFLQTLASEHAEMLGASAEQAVAIESFGDMPLLVLASDVPNPAFGESAEAYQQFWADESRALAAKSSNGEFILAKGSGHNIHLDRPELVINAINQMLQ